MINAGEIDGLSVGDSGTLWRAGRRIGRVELAKVQRGYSAARLLGDSGHVATTQAVRSDEQRAGSAPDSLRRLDEVRFSPPPSSPVTLGVIERVLDGTLFSARVEETRVAPLRTPKGRTKIILVPTLQRAGRTIGVAVLLEVADGRALGFAVTRSLTVRLAAGDVLTVSPEHRAQVRPSASLTFDIFEQTRPATIIRESCRRPSPPW